METQPAQPRSAREGRFPLWAAPAAAAAVVVLAAMLVINRGGDDNKLNLSEVPQGVSARTVGDKPVFVVRDGDHAQVFAADARHLPDDTLWWCPNEQIFVGREHAEQFDRSGLFIAGPARGGLNEYPSVVANGTLEIDMETVIEGDKSERGEAPPELARADYAEPWNSGPGSFCDGAVVPPTG